MRSYLVFPGSVSRGGRDHTDLSRVQSVRAWMALPGQDLHTSHQCLQARRSQLKSSLP